MMNLSSVIRMMELSTDKMTVSEDLAEFHFLQNEMYDSKNDLVSSHKEIHPSKNELMTALEHAEKTIGMIEDFGDVKSNLQYMRFRVQAREMISSLERIGEIWLKLGHV